MRRRLVGTLGKAALAASSVAFLMVASVTSGAGQQSGRAAVSPDSVVYQIELSDGSTVYGRIEAEDSATVTVRTVGGVRMEIPRDRIVTMDELRGRVADGEVVLSDPNPTRLLFSSTGRSLPAGEGYVGTYLVVLPFVAVGLTDAITIAGGAPVTLGEIEPFYLAPKVRVLHGDRSDVSVGLLHFVWDEDDGGLVYGVGTFGAPDQALTVGLGFGYEGTDIEAEPVVLLGGESRTGRRTKFVTENYLLPGAGLFAFSAALRIMGQRFSTDVGVLGAGGGDDVDCCVPLVNFSYAFGASSTRRRPDLP